MSNYETRQNALNAQGFNQERVKLVSCELFDASIVRLNKQGSNTERKSNTFLLISASSACFRFMKNPLSFSKRNYFKKKFGMVLRSRHVEFDNLAAVLFGCFTFNNVFVQAAREKMTGKKLFLY